MLFRTREGIGYQMDPDMFVEIVKLMERNLKPETVRIFARENMIATVRDFQPEEGR